MAGAFGVTVQQSDWIQRKVGVGLEEVGEQVLGKDVEEAVVEGLVLEEVEDVEDAAAGGVVAEQVAQVVGHQAEQLGFGQDFGHFFDALCALGFRVREMALWPQALPIHDKAFVYVFASEICSQIGEARGLGFPIFWAFGIRSGYFANFE